MYKYFVSFAYSDGEKTAFGNVEFLAKEPITDIKTLRDFEGEIRESYEFEYVAVLNYILLKKFGE